MHAYDAYGLSYFISSSGVMQFREVCYTVVSYAPYIYLRNKETQQTLRVIVSTQYHASF